MKRMARRTPSPQRGEQRRGDGAAGVAAVAILRRRPDAAHLDDLGQARVEAGIRNQRAVLLQDPVRSLRVPERDAARRIGAHVGAGRGKAGLDQILRAPLDAEGQLLFARRPRSAAVEAGRGCGAAKARVRRAIRSPALCRSAARPRRRGLVRAGRRCLAAGERSRSGQRGRFVRGGVEPATPAKWRKVRLFRSLPFSFEAGKRGSSEALLIGAEIVARPKRIGRPAPPAGRPSVPPYRRTTSSKSVYVGSPANPSSWFVSVSV